MEAFPSRPSSPVLHSPTVDPCRSQEYDIRSMTHQNTPDHLPSSGYSFDAISFLDAQPSTQTPSLGELYSIYGANLADSTTSQPVTVHDTPLQDVEYPGLSFSATDTLHSRAQMPTPEAVDQRHQLPPTNLGWHVVAPHYSNPLFQGLPAPSHGLNAFPNPPSLPVTSPQQQRRLLPSGLLHNFIGPNTSPQLSSPSSSLQPEPRPLPPVATSSKRRHPLLANNFRELAQSKERDLLIQVLHSEWLAAQEEEPQDTGRSILMGFLHRSNPQSSLRCSFDGCTRTFDRQDRAVAHVRQLHLNFKPYTCGGACGKRSCKDRFSSWSYLRSHVKKIKANCSKCGKELIQKNLSRHTTSCGKTK